MKEELSVICANHVMDRLLKKGLFAVWCQSPVTTQMREKLGEIYWMIEEEIRAGIDDSEGKIVRLG